MIRQNILTVKQTNKKHLSKTLWGAGAIDGFQWVRMLVAYAQGSEFKSPAATLKALVPKPLLEPQLCWRWRWEARWNTLPASLSTGLMWQRTIDERTYHPPLASTHVCINTHTYTCCTLIQDCLTVSWSIIFGGGNHHGVPAHLCGGQRSASGLTDLIRLCCLSTEPQGVADFHSPTPVPQTCTSDVPLLPDFSKGVWSFCLSSRHFPSIPPPQPTMTMMLLVCFPSRNPAL